MSIGDDPLRRVLDAVNGSSAALRAARGMCTASELHDRLTAGRRHFDEMLALRPGLPDDIARGHRHVSALFEANPTIFDQMSRHRSEFEKFASGAIMGDTFGRLGSLEAAIMGADRLKGALSHHADYERLIGARAFVSDSVVDMLAARGALSPLVERLSAPGTLHQRVIDQLGNMSRMVAQASGALPGYAELSGAFPDLVPALRLPTAGEIAGVDLSVASGLREPDKAWLAATAAQIGAIDIPWVRDDRPELAIAGYAALRGLTDVVGRTDPAAPRVTQMARAELGDYRREDASDEAVDDPMLVSGLRLARGFSLKLASLPMALAGSVFAPFGMVAGPTPQADPDELDTAIALMFRQLERKLRAFIDRAMRAGVGDRWVRQRVHKDVRDEWERRRQIDIDIGRTPGELFDYADFGDYRTIIEQGDNWRDVFQPVFRVKTAIGETLGRLSTIRNPVAHVRPLSIEDLLIVRVDGRRLYVWIGEVVP